MELTAYSAFKEDAEHGLTKVRYDVLLKFGFKLLKEFLFCCDLLGPVWTIRELPDVEADGDCLIMSPYEELFSPFDEQLERHWKIIKFRITGRIYSA